MSILHRAVLASFDRPRVVISACLLVTLLAINGPAVGVVTEGLVYPLRGETLEPGSSRGVSNVFEAETGRVSLEQGVLLAVLPGESE